MVRSSSASNIEGTPSFRDEQRVAPTSYPAPGAAKPATSPAFATVNGVSPSPRMLVGRLAGRRRARPERLRRRRRAGRDGSGRPVAAVGHAPRSPASRPPTLRDRLADPHRRSRHRDRAPRADLQHPRARGVARGAAARVLPVRRDRTRRRRHHRPDRRRDAQPGHPARGARQVGDQDPPEGRRSTPGCPTSCSETRSPTTSPTRRPAAPRSATSSRPSATGGSITINFTLSAKAVEQDPDLVASVLATFQWIG